MINIIASVIFLIVAGISLLPLGKNLAGAADTVWRGGNSVDAKNLTQGDSTYRDPVNGSDGQRLRFRVVAINDGDVPAENARVKFDLSNSVTPSAEVTADNTAIQADTVAINPGGTALNYIAGSAKKYGPSCPSGCTVGDEIVASGVSLGNVAPGAEQSYQLSIEADLVGGSVPTDIPVFRSGNIHDGGNRTDRVVDWQDPIPADPGEVIEFRIQVINDGQATAENTQLLVVLPDVLSTTLVSKAYINGANAAQVSDTATVNVSGSQGQLFEYIPGHTRKFGPDCTNPDGCPLPDGITLNGISLGSTVEPGVTNSYQVAYKVYVSNYQPTPSPSPEPLVCYDECGEGATCPSGLSCLDVGGVNRCVNPACVEETDCVCPTPSPSPSPSPTPSPTPSPSPSPTPSPSPSPEPDKAGFVIRKFNDTDKDGYWDGNETSTGRDWYFDYRLNDGDWQEYKAWGDTGWGGVVSVDTDTKVEVREREVAGWTNTTGLTAIKILDEEKTYYFDFGNFQPPTVVTVSPPPVVPQAGAGSSWLPWLTLAGIGLALQLAALLL